MAPSAAKSKDAFPLPARAPALVPSPRWVRVNYAGETIASSKATLLLRHDGRRRLPAYYFPESDVRMELLLEGSGEKDSSERVYYTLRAGDRRAVDAAWRVVEPTAEAAGLEGYVSFKWNAMESWYEEEEQIYVHPRDPYHRVDVLASSRHVRVSHHGQTVADTRRPFLLFETGLPTRYYFDPQDVRTELLEPTAHTSRCPYKGIASYWGVKVGGTVADNLVWGYQDPIPEQPKIRGLLCFFNEKVDLFVDGELQSRPSTLWS